MLSVVLMAVVLRPKDSISKRFDLFQDWQNNDL